MIKICFYLVSALGAVFLVAAFVQAYLSASFAASAEVHPGRFLGYSKVLVGQPGMRGDGMTGSRPPSARYFALFDVELEDGQTYRVEGDQPQALRLLDHGDPIEVLVPPDRQTTPRIKSFPSLYGMALFNLLLGGLGIVLPQLVLRRLTAPKSRSLALLERVDAMLPIGEALRYLAFFGAVGVIFLGVAYFFLSRSLDSPPSATDGDRSEASVPHGDG